MQPKMEILLVDDHVVVRNGLRELIEKLGPYRVVDEFDNGHHFLGWLNSGNRADLVILDYSMPDMNGEEVLQAMNASGFGIPVLVLTLNEDERTIVRLFRNGARGYLLKTTSAGVLRNAIDEILRCGYFHNEFLTLSLRQDTPAARKTEQQRVLEQLTDGEREFLRLVCNEKEYTYEQIADSMGVSARRVDGFREDLFSKFGIKSKTGLVLFVLKHRLFEMF